MTKRNQPCPCGSKLKYKKCCGHSTANNTSSSTIDHQQAQTISPAEKEGLLNLYYAKKMIKAEQACRELLQTYPQSSYLYNLIGITLKEQNRFLEAEEVFEKAIQLKPDYAAAHCNQGIALRYLGRLDEAIQSMQNAMENAPEDVAISDSLVNLLNHYLPTTKTTCLHIKAQQSLQLIRADHPDTSMITDETVRQLYQQCHNILASQIQNIDTNKSQLYRGALSDNNCNQHMMVFNKFKTIPEYCFDCYKVTIEPRTVMELFKLLLVFDKLKLPLDNTRKCIVEMRPGISGTYKGLIYCHNFAEGKEILPIIQQVVGKAITPEIPIFLKRGCSEFPIAYPEYGHITDDESQQMPYNKEWRKHQEYVNKNMTTQTAYNPNKFTLNHSGFTLLDILVMRKWLAYAKKIDDLSYFKIVE